MVAGRLAAVAVALFVGAAGAAVYPWWVAPVTPLAAEAPAPARPPQRVALAPAITDVDPGPMQRILADGAPDLELAAVPPITPALRQRFGRLVQDLANDGIRGNAMSAIWRLRDPAALPLLVEALASDDMQQRQLAGVALRRLGAPPTPGLARVTVEALELGVERALYSTLGDSVIAEAVRYLYHHRGVALPELRAALWNRDPGVRFHAAFLLACNGDPEHVTIVARILIDHLCDNDISGDALMACHALHMLGREALPALHSWRHHPDPQAAQLIELVLLDIEQPPRTLAELRQRQAMHGVTGVYFDPAIEFDVGRSPVRAR